MKRNSIDATINPNGNNNTSQVSMNKPQTAEGVSRRRKREYANGNSRGGENYFDLNDQKEQLINELKRASADTNPVRHTSQIHYNIKKRDYQ